MKKVIIVLVIGLAVMLGMTYFNFTQTTSTASEKKINGVYLTKPTAIDAFNLTDNHNQSFTQANLKNHWTLMFFGFTNCGMICPTTLAALKQMYQQLELQLSAQEIPQVLFVSVDPDRDSVQKLNDYVNAFNSNFIGARADINETVKLEKQLHIVAAKMQLDHKGKNHYTINHSAEILVINPEGQLQAYLSYPHTPDSLIKDYKAIIAG